MPIKADKNLRAYYNEIDPYAAQWLRNLMDEGWITKGDVDERSIEDVRPSDLTGYDRVHFFAGIGVWDYALNQAGYGRNKVWTGSCPCQPFSSAGKRTGFADERHLWPAWFHLIEQCRPAIIFGEQVASKDGLAWLDLVQADLEVAGYASGAVDLCAAGVGAPHIRQRLWWVAERLGHHHHQRLEGHAGYGDGAPGRAITAGSIVEAGGAGGVVNADEQQRNGSRDAGPGRRAESAISGPTRGLADGERVRHAELQRGRNNDLACGENSERPRIGLEPGRAIDRPGPTNGFWRDADWLFCRDGKWRPVEPGPQQMVDGSADCVGRVCSEGITKAEEEIDGWSKRHSADAGEALRNLWVKLSEEALGERAPGGPWGIFEAPVLLAFLRQLSEQGWRFSDALTCSRSGASRVVLRALRIDREAACPSYGRELAEQRPGETANPLRELSQILARNAESSWGETCRAYAGRGFPLAKNAPARVGRLRAYGNAINAEAAKVFIEAVMDWLGYGDL